MIAIGRRCGSELPECTGQSAKRVGEMSVRFEWDRQKARINIRKHRGVTFDEASTVFGDPLAAIFDDEGHSTGESREIIIGHSIVDRLLVVCFTERARDVIRIFSARLATQKEREDHEKHCGRNAQES